ncbi:MAG: hypothetical protein K2I23_01940 [Clostridia bacterium]|nr:hypothetical protein [Clostridia bacterium]
MKGKIFGISLILCLALVLCFASVFSTRDVATAENVDVLVSLADDSLLTAYGDYFAYTNSKGIYLAKDNKVLSYQEKSDFDGFIDIAMNSTHILALAKKGEQKYLWAYEYNDMRIAKINFSLSDLHVEYLVGIYANDDGFYAMETNKLIHISINPPEVLSQYFNSNTDWTLNPAYVSVQDFAVLNNVMYCILDGDFYAISEQNFKGHEDLPKFLKRSGEFTGISVSGDNILLLSQSGVNQYNTLDSSFSTLTVDGIDGNSKICSGYDSKNDIRYVYTKSSLNAVNMYVHTDDDLEYYGCFDNTIYTHPTDFDIVKLYKTGDGVTLYSSPRHLQRMGIIPQGKYFIVLSERDEYLYVYYHDAVEDKTQYGYIRKSANITLCPAEKEGILGQYAQPLHQNTAIYKYPFEGAGSEKILDATIFMQLIVIDNVGQDGDFTWGWYKVGYVNDEGKTQYGYVKTQNLSPYTQLTAPSLSKSAKLTSKKLGQYITLYALPFDNEEDAIVVTELPEGTSVYLKEKFNKKSEWTAVYYEGKTAYAKTVNVKASGLTSWQIALVITIPCAVVAIVIATVLIVAAKKKKLATKIY